MLPSSKTSNSLQTQRKLCNGGYKISIDVSRSGKKNSMYPFVDRRTGAIFFRTKY